MSKNVKLINLAADLNVGIESMGEMLKNKAGHSEITPNTRITREEYEILKKELLKGESKEKLNSIEQKYWPSEDIVKPNAKEEKVELPKAPSIKVVGSINDINSKKNNLNSDNSKKTIVDVDVKADTKKVFASDKKDSNAKIKNKEHNTEVKPNLEKGSDIVNNKTKVKENLPKEEKKVSVETSNKETVNKKPNLEAKETKIEQKIEVKNNTKDNTPTSTPTLKEENKSTNKSEEALTSLHSGQGAPSIKVVGKIDLSTINDATRPQKRSDKKKDGKRKRIKGNAVDVNEEAAKAEKQSNNKKKNAQGQSKSSNNPQTNKQNNNQPQAGSESSKKKKKKNQANQKDVKVQISEEDVQKQVKETLARLTNKKTASSKGAKYRKDKRIAARNAALDALEESELESKTLKLTEFVTVSDLANMMDVPVNQLIATLMSLGMMVSINMRLEAETIDLIAEEFGYRTEYISADLAESIPSEDEEDSEEDLESRPPIVTVMGHVDHGKTSLLDRLRNSNVIDGEAGGITQHIGAYSLKLENGKRITFLDTPGHEAFTAMRARGAKITDIAIIIVAADDDVMPQTKEAINHASAAGVPIVFAINKIDKPHANPDRIREQLAAMNYLVEEWGGKYQSQEISAKQGLNIDKLLDKVLLEAELLELKANPKRRATGTVIESSLDKGRGYVATVMVQNGSLSMGDIVLSGTHHGRIKAMFNERNKKIDKAGPSTPVLILGLDGAPTAGESFVVMDSEQEARTIANKREQLKREQDNRTKKGLTLEELARRKALGNFQELNIIVKGDVDGSIEAISDSLIKLSTEEIQVNILHKGVGQISESDVVLASASSAIIIGFQVRPSQAARRLADKEGVEIRTYSIIYSTIEDIKSAMEGMLSPEIKENITANIEVLQTFKVSKVGTIAGCIVTEGKIKRTNKIRLIRDGIVKYEGALGSLKRYKDDAKEVVMGQECGLNIEGYNDIMVGDIIEAYEEIEVKKTLDSIQ